MPALHWLRTKKRFCTYWALFALVVQFASAFGHALHLQHAKHAVASLKFAHVSNSHPAAVSTAPAMPISPAGSAFDCEVCTAVSLAGSALPATAPQPVLPIFAARIHFFPHIDAATAMLPHRTFQARAPPIA